MLEGSLIRKNAVVTGASRGIGHALTKKLAENDYNVWACASVYREEFQDFCNELSMENNVRVEPVCFDLTDYNAIKDAYMEITRRDRRIDVLVNNAGIGHMNFLQLTKAAEIDRIYKVNILAPIYLSQLVLRNMQRQGGGKIINIASMAAYEVYEGNSIYGSTKAALAAFTKSFAAEAYRYGVTVNAVAPGLVDTEMSPVFEGKDPEEPLRHMVLGRKIHPEEIAETVIELLSDRLKLVNGEVIGISGGHK